MPPCSAHEASVAAVSVWRVERPLCNARAVCVEVEWLNSRRLDETRDPADFSGWRLSFCVLAFRGKLQASVLPGLAVIVWTLYFVSNEYPVYCTGGHAST